LLALPHVEPIFPPTRSNTTTQGYYGHVAYVESVNSNGSVRVSEMNYGHGAGVMQQLH
jgi:surface antigen